MNSEMPKDLKRWEVTRQKGKLQFVLQTGMLMWGLPMFVVMTFVVNRRPEKSPALIAISAVIWAIGGACYGWLMWAITESRYQKYLAKQNAENPGQSVPPLPPA